MKCRTCGQGIDYVNGVGEVCTNVGCKSHDMSMLPIIIILLVGIIKVINS